MYSFISGIPNMSKSVTVKESGGRGLTPPLKAIVQVYDSKHVTVLSLPVFLFDHHIVPVGS